MLSAYQLIVIIMAEALFAKEYQIKIAYNCYHMVNVKLTQK